MKQFITPQAASDSKALLVRKGQKVTRATKAIQATPDLKGRRAFKVCQDCPAILDRQVHKELKEYKGRKV